MLATSFTAAPVAIVATAIFVSALVTVVAGFGFTLMAVPLMSLAIDVHSAVIVSSIVAVLTNGSQAYLYRGVRSRALANRLLIASILGLPFGYVVFTVVSDRVLRLTLGVGVVLAVAALARGLDLSHRGQRLDWALGFLSGVLTTSISTSGPPLVFDLQARNLGPDPFRATTNYIFLWSGIIGLALFASGGKIHADELRTGLIAAPAVALGMVAGRPLRNRFSAERFRALVLVLLVAGAVAAASTVFT